MKLANKLLLPTLALTLAFTSPTQSLAQIGIYGTLTATHINNPTTTQSNAANADNTSYWTTGGTIGVYDDFLHLGPLSLGPDLRYSGASGARYGLGGARLALHPPILPFKPYIEAMIGGASASDIYNLRTSAFTYEVLGGVDYTLLPHVDFRAIEIGGGQISDQKRSFLTVSSGLVVRF